MTDITADAVNIAALQDRNQKVADAAKNADSNAEKRTAKWSTDYLVYGGCVLLALLLLAVPASGDWSNVAWKGEAVTSVFSSMMLIALFVERAIEVFVSVWVDRASAVHEQNLDYWQEREATLTKGVQALIAERNAVPAPDAAQLAEIDNALAGKRAAIEQADFRADVEAKALVPFAARTQKVSTWVGLVIGMVAAAIGFRFLGQLVTLPTSPALSPAQSQVFVAADVLLTGAVLSGGSKLVHSIFSVYGSFMESTKKTLQDPNRS